MDMDIGLSINVHVKPLDVDMDINHLHSPIHGRWKIIQQQQKLK